MIRKPVSAHEQRNALEPASPTSRTAAPREALERIVSNEVRDRHAAAVLAGIGSFRSGDTGSVDYDEAVVEAVR